MATAYEVARYFVRLAAAEEEPDFLTPLRLQKLLYYAQAWSLVQRGAPLFPERIEAWANGPVVRDLYARFADGGRLPILPDQVRADEPIDLGEDEAKFVENVWNSYKGYSAWSLREMTHREAPWLEARNGHAPGERCDTEITKAALAHYFSSLTD